GRAIPPARGREATRTPAPASPGRISRPDPGPDPRDEPVPASLDVPVGLTSHEQPERPPEPSFGSDIVVGSDVVPALPANKCDPMATTASAVPFALEDAFLQDLEMPPDARGAASESNESVESASRRLSARFTIAECRVRWGRG